MSSRLTSSKKFIWSSRFLKSVSNFFLPPYNILSGMHLYMDVKVYEICEPRLMDEEEGFVFWNGCFIFFAVVHLLLQWWMWCYKMYPNTFSIYHKNEIKYQHLKYFWHYSSLSSLHRIIHLPPSFRLIWKYIGGVGMWFYENLTWNLMSFPLLRVNFSNKT